MRKKLSSISFWLFVFVAIIAVQAYSTFSQTVGFIGKWQTGNVSLLQYQNQVTGATRPGRSSLFSYRFLPNGNYEFIGLMEINVYNCTSTYFNQITGKYTVEGSTIYLNPSRDFWRSGNSCAASATKEVTKTPTRKSISYQLRADDYGKELLCITDGEAESCFQRDRQ